MKHLSLYSAAILALTLSTNVLAENYKIIVDAGSSGSRLHLYQYTSDKKVPVIEEGFTKSNKTGLSTFEKNPQDSGKSLQELLDGAAQYLKDKQINPKDVEVNVLATAGMRLVNENIQKEIYASVKNSINTSGFNIGQVETISGQMEAFYGWMEVNYRANSFENNATTLGAIDMGGASTQISFETQDPNKPEDVISFNFAGKKYAVFAKSFLGLGQDQAREAILTDNDAATCFPTNYHKPDSTLVGNFNAKSCGALYTNFIKTKKVAEQILPIDKQKFVAFSGAYYTYNFLAVDKTPDQAVLEEGISTVCTKSWEKLESEHKGDKYLWTYCASAVYMDNLFYNTYQIGNNQLTVAKQINGHNIDWAEGALFYNLIKN